MDNISDIYSIQTLTNTIIDSYILIKAYTKIEFSINKEEYNLYKYKYIIIIYKLDNRNLVYLVVLI